MTDNTEKMILNLPRCKDGFERCAACGKKTYVSADMPIEMRSCYVEGAGQLCRDCWAEIYGQ